MYPEPVRLMAREMADELESNRLEVVLLPHKRAMHPAQMVRATTSTNPEWYQKLCAQFVSSRKRGHRQNRTAIKRREALRALRRIAEGKGPRRNSHYAPRYIELLLPVVEYELKHIADRRKRDEQPVAPVQVAPAAVREDWELW